LDIIQLLPEHVANQIAAGEVIGRPASAVKEMLENALDSGATNIKLYIKDSGKTLLQVVDNGCGMSDADARMSFERHATSKINKADDLFAIKTMGFRGEAMASLAAIAHVEMKSKLTEKELGTHIIIEGGQVKKQEDCSCANGTSISIKNLFYNVPARRNFLKSDKVETRHIIEQFSRIALANPDINMSLHLDDLEYFHLEKSNKRQRIVSVTGAKSNQKLVPIQEQTTLVNISGFIGKPEFCKRTRGEQYFFVNNRFIKSPYLHHAVKKAYDGLIPDNYFPSYFLYLDIDPKLIDINIHPTKTEIKFEDERSIYAIIRSAVKHSLGKYNVAPTIDFNLETSFDISIKEKGKVYNQPKIKVDTDFNPFEKEKPTEIFSWGDIVEKANIQQEIEVDWTQKIQEKQLLQIKNKFILLEGKTEILIIHQQRAHERILFEYYQNLFENKKVESQQLAFPFNLTFSNSDYLLIIQLKEPLHNLGFGFELKGENKIEINSIPPECAKGNLETLFEEFLEQEKNDNQLVISTKVKIAKVLAKNIAIKKGKKIEQNEMKVLISNLFACDLPSISPNGKPTIINLALNDITKHF
jgi:DNA mismatch repair protein MutL|tara:strand:+ start:5003 stop:6757 length:1755 start_codon:yes stop_codon:yes gene_type:complete